MVETYFFDTYAFFEIIAGNDRYKRYAKGIVIVTTKLNLMELYYGLLLKYNEEIAEKYYGALIKFAIEINDDITKSAMKFRFLHKNENLSYVDCIGYTIAKSMGIKFLTGDLAFKDLENVEFVE